MMVPSDAVVVFKLDGTISERAGDNPFAGLFGNKFMDEELGLDNILRAIKNAKENDKVKGIYMEAGSLGGATPAMLQEIRQALVDFKTSDKFIVAYGDQYSQGAYYLCSVADSVIINPEGMLDWKGLAMQTTYSHQRSTLGYCSSNSSVGLCLRRVKLIMPVSLYFTPYLMAFSISLFLPLALRKSSLLLRIILCPAYIN